MRGGFGEVFVVLSVLGQQMFIVLAQVVVRRLIATKCSQIVNFYTHANFV